MKITKTLAAGALSSALLTTTITAPAQAEDTTASELSAAGAIGSAASSNTAAYSISSIIGTLISASVSVAFLYLLWYLIVRPAPGTAPIAIPGL